jgi:DNA-3-methyladenine glycosylase I
LKDRCPWPLGNPQMLRYHDEEWGEPLTDDRKLFEFLTLETFQAGLSWAIVLRKRENFRKAFAGFDFKKVARFGARDVKRLGNDAGIVRNRAKILAAINNARRVLEVRKEFGTFSRYMWAQVGGRPVVHRFRSIKELPPFTPEALAWAKDLKRRGFRFMGATVVYAHMQAVGMVNDHMTGCYRYAELRKRRAPFA